MSKRNFFSFLAVLSLAAGAMASEWKIDNVHSSIGFKVRHFFAKQAGEFGKFSGAIYYDPEQPHDSHVEATIEAASIDTGHESRDNHLRSSDFFDVENYPAITFKSTKVEVKDDELVVTGDLTMKGVTKTISFPIEFLGAGPDGRGGQRAGFSAELKLDRKDFGITWNNTLDHGGTVVGDEVTISLEIEAVGAKVETESR